MEINFIKIMKIKKNFLVISNYNNDISWVPEYTNNYVIYNKRSNLIKITDIIDPKKIMEGSICGYNSYEYFTFIIDNYENLPNCTIFAKGWTFPRHIRKDHFDKIMNNEFFTPIEDWEMYHPIFPVAFLSPDGGFCEINNSWYLKKLKTKYFNNYNDFLRFVYKDPIILLYVRLTTEIYTLALKEDILILPNCWY